MSNFGSIVKKRRLQLGFKLEAVARKAGTHKGCVSGMERGGVNPPAIELSRRIAKALQLDEQELAIIGYVDKAPEFIREELKRRALQAVAKTFT